MQHDTYAPREWLEIVRWLTEAGFQVVSHDPASGVLTVRVPDARKD